jgi:hypothetical protein
MDLSEMPTTEFNVSCTSQIPVLFQNSYRLILIPIKWRVTYLHFKHIQIVHCPIKGSQILSHAFKRWKCILLKPFRSDTFHTIYGFFVLIGTPLRVFVISPDAFSSHSRISIPASHFSPRFWSLIGIKKLWQCSQFLRHFESWLWICDLNHYQIQPCASEEASLFVVFDQRSWSHQYLDWSQSKVGPWKLWICAIIVLLRRWILSVRDVFGFTGIEDSQIANGRQSFLTIQSRGYQRWERKHLLGLTVLDCCWRSVILRANDGNRRKMTAI